MAEYNGYFLSACIGNITQNRRHIKRRKSEFAARFINKLAYTISEGSCLCVLVVSTVDLRLEGKCTEHSGYKRRKSAERSFDQNHDTTPPNVTGKIHFNRQTTFNHDIILSYINEKLKRIKAVLSKVTIKFYDLYKNKCTKSIYRRILSVMSVILLLLDRKNSPFPRSSAADDGQEHLR